MTQSCWLLPVLLLLAACSSIVCPSSRMHSDRRDRAPYIETDENSPQYLAEAGGLGPSRSRKMQMPAPPQAPLTKNFYHISKEELDEQIKSIFITNPAHFPSKPAQRDWAANDELMSADQSQPQPLPPPLPPPSPSSPPSPPSTSSTDSRPFIVQRSPNGKLNVVYDKTLAGAKDPSLSNPASAVVNRTQTTDGAMHSTEVKSHSGPTANQKPKPGPIRFPTEDGSSYSVVTENCEESDQSPDKLFCTNVRNYPDKAHLEEILQKKFSNLQLFFGEDLQLPENISQRMDNGPNDEYLCKSRTRIVYPMLGVTKDSNWLTIVNLPNYKQGIIIEECINEGSTCGESSGLMLPNHYTATCKQSYIYRSLIAYQNETILRDQFRMPSCCKCVLRNQNT